MVRTILALLLGLASAVGAPSGVRAEEPTDALTVRALRIDRQLERVIALFEGARAPNPAAALAGWKRATHGLGRPQLGKGLEAAIAALNPGMVRELVRLEEIKVGLGFDPDNGQARWYVAAPGDDGTLAALLTATALTEGEADASFREFRVDRLGPPGAPLALRIPGALALAATRADLSTVLAEVRKRQPSTTSEETGWRFEVKPEQIPLTGPISRQRAIEALRASDLSRIKGSAGIEGDTFKVTTTSELRKAAFTGSIDPAWLDWIPASGVLAGVSLAIDASPTAWDARFAWADRVERVDPLKGQLAPLRTRLILLSIAAGIQPEVDLFPKIRGVTAYTASASPWVGRLNSLVLALHVADETSADRLATHLFPRLVAALSKQPVSVAREDGTIPLGTVSGREVVLRRSGSTLLFGWGVSSLDSALAAKEDTARSAGTTLRELGGKNPPQRLGVVWTDQLARPLLNGASPVVWVGRNQEQALSDELTWSGLKGIVQRFLTRVPLEYPINP